MCKGQSNGDRRKSRKPITRRSLAGLRARVRTEREEIAQDFLWSDSDDII